jgi:hypothetical protein
MDKRVTITPQGAVASYDRKAFLYAVHALYGPETRDAVLVAGLPPEEKLRVIRHRQRESADS